MRGILQEEAPVLRQVAKPVPEKLFGTEELSRLVADMAEALDEEPDGVALAAPQIGVPYRIFIVRKDRTLPPPRFSTSNATMKIQVQSQGELPPPMPEGTELPERAAEVEVYINPEIMKTSRKRQHADEGCLSVRGRYGTTHRHERVSVRARRENGARFTRGGGGLLAQIFEHEIDHLNGVLFIDHAEDVVTLSERDSAQA